MSSGHWLALARRCLAAAEDPTVAGVVITHGTDTLEETAFALDLLAPPALGLVLTGAMRPATAAGADGPGNLRAACVVASDPGAIGRGALLVFADRAWQACHVGKRHSTSPDAFDGGEREAVATISDRVHWRGPAAPRGAASGHGPGRPTFVDLLSRSSDRASLPPVGLFWQHVDADPAWIDWQVARGLRGLVVAATGAGTMPDPVRAALARAVSAGCLVVRASRVSSGSVRRDNEPEPADRDSALGFVAAGSLAPLKARILLQCCLALGLAPADAEQVQRLFDAYD